MSDRNFLILALAAVAASFFYQQQNDLQTKLNTCTTQFESFKSGVIYGK